MNQAPDDSISGDLLDIFSQELRNYKQSQEIYRSLCNTTWEKDGRQVSYSWRSAGGLLADLRNSLDLKIADSEICGSCNKSKKDHLEESIAAAPFWSDREITLTGTLCPQEKGRFIPGYSGPEDYMDFYCSGGEGQVPDWVKNKMQQAGYRMKK